MRNQTDRSLYSNERGLAGRAVVLVATLVASVLALAQPAPKTDETLGELLYSTHCVACHTTQIHWRDHKLATDWTTLVAQVRRWQGNLNLGWSDADVAAVARYLNTRYYRFPGAPGAVAFGRVDDLRYGP